MPQIPFKRTVVLADGTEVRGSAGMDESHPVLWIWLESGYDKDEMTALFSDPEKTKVIKDIVDMPILHTRSAKSYEGYTEVAQTRMNGEQVHIMMRRPEQE